MFSARQKEGIFGQQRAKRGQCNMICDGSRRARQLPACRLADAGEMRVVLIDVMSAPAALAVLAIPRLQAL
jgi:hypothetical protein